MDSSYQGAIVILLDQYSKYTYQSYKTARNLSRLLFQILELCIQGHAGWKITAQWQLKPGQ